jgi:transposase
MYKKHLAKDPNTSMKQLKQRISERMGVGESTVHQIIHVYKRTNSVVPPKRTKVRETFRDSFDEPSRNRIRRLVHLVRTREIPTVDRIHEAVSGDACLPPISRTNLHRLLRGLGFRYTKGTRHRALTEKSGTVLRRRRYLENVERYVAGKGGACTTWTRRW